jgi:LysM repeat protein
VQSNIRIAVVTILSIHAVLFAGLLMQGCKPESQKTAQVDAQPFDPNMFPSQPPVTPGVDPTAPMPPPPLPVTGGQPMVAGIPDPAAMPTPVPMPETAAVPAPVPGLPVTTADPSAVPMPPLPETVPTVPAAPEVGAAREHVIAKGDVIANLAKQYGVSSSAILAANPGIDPKRLKLGAKITIPPATAKATASAAPATAPTGDKVYVVKSGDNLTKIAKQFGTTINDLRKVNGLKTDRLSVGQKIKVPTKIATAPEVTVPTAQGVPPPPPGPVVPQ